MVVKDAKLAEHVLDIASVEQAPTRVGFGEGLVLAADADPNVVGLCADLTESTKMDAFAKKYPDRFVEIGVAEQNLATVASGMAAMGKVPYITSYAMFSPGRNWEQIRTTIAYNNQHVIVVGSHTGVSVGPDGATHQTIEDIAIMRVIANMTVLAPCDTHEARKATLAAATYPGPVYIRFAREKTPICTTLDTPFTIGKAQIFWEPDAGEPQIAIMACGPLVHNALLAAAELQKEGINAIVLNHHTIKPIDSVAIVEVARRAGTVVTVEEHQVTGGFGSAVAEVLAREFPVPVEFVGVQNRFGESGSPNELIEKFGMGVSHIKDAVRRAVQRKS